MKTILILIIISTNYRAANSIEHVVFETPEACQAVAEMYEARNITSAWKSQSVVYDAQCVSAK